MPSRNGTLALVLSGSLFAVFIWVLSAYVFRQTPWWLIVLVFLPPLASWMLDSSRRTNRFQERCEFSCHVREIPGGGAGLSGRWRSAVLVPYRHRLSITGYAAERPSAAHITWDEPVEEGLVQLHDVVEAARRDPSLFEALRFGPAGVIARYQCEGALVEVAAPPRYLDAARSVLHADPAAG